MVKISESKTGAGKMDLTIYITIVAMFSMLLVAANASPTRELEVVMPEECKNPDRGFCTIPYNEHIRQRIEHLLTSDYQVELGDVFEHFNDRQGFDDDEQTDCKKTLHQDPIYEIHDENDNVRAVVQSEKHFMQTVEREICEKPGRLIHATKHFKAIDLKFNHVTCTQVTIPYTFLALSLDGASLEMVKSKYEIPIHCACLLISK